MSLIPRAIVRRTRAALPPAAALALLAAALAGLLASGGCRRESPAEPAAAPVEPTAAVLQLAADLRNNDLAAYARHALPPALHARMASAWQDGRTIWPLTELPLDDRLPAFITALAAADAEKDLLAAYQHQFAGADRELRSAAATLGLFAGQYVREAGDYSPAEREHYLQLVTALSQWARQAPLADGARAKAAIRQLTAAARLTALAGGTDAFHRLGMERSLGRLGPFFGRFKQVLVGYGLDFDQALDGVQVALVEQTGDRARVSLDYTLAGQPIRAEVRLERRDGHWYLSDLLRHAETAAGPEPVAPEAPATPAAGDRQAPELTVR
jgi:hypothetical protein